MIGRLFAALARGVASQLHPAMLALLLLPFLLAALGWGLITWWIWDPLLDWLRVSLFGDGGWLGWVLAIATRFGLEGLRGVLAVAIAILLILPAWFATALVITAVVAMPAVNRFLSRRAYRDVERRGGWSIAASLWNGIATLAVFFVGYLLTLPLWLLPPLAVVVPWLWWSWLTSRVLRFDSLVEHAAPDERVELIARHRSEYLALGVVVTMFNYVPPLFLVMPVLASLVFGHFSLSRLRESRERLRVDQTQAPLPQPADPQPSPHHDLRPDHHR
jgi:uncharacterized protein involved in cysteine biosynthesis